METCAERGLKPLKPLEDVATRNPFLGLNWALFWLRIKKGTDYF